jgi:flagellar hook-length control protein FliK
MSELAASIMGNSLPAEGNSVALKQSTQGNSAQGPGGAAFPQLFASINPEQATVENDLMVISMNPFAPLPIVSSTDLPMQPTMQIAGFSEFIGNNLPQNLPAISVSGFVAEGDQTGATAISFVGDDQQVFATTPQQAKGLTTAVQQSQLQLRDGLQQQLSTPQTDFQDLSLGIQNKAETAKQMELIAEMAKQTESVSDSLIHKPTSTTGFSQLLSGPLAQQDIANTSLNTARGLDPMTATLQQPHWNTQVGERINMMISKGMQQAEIRLNPPELGLLEVKVQIQGDQATVHFSSPHAQVRDALDAALPRLRDMLEENGLTLGDVNVSQQSLAQGQSHSGNTGDEQTASAGRGLDHDTGQTEVEAPDKNITKSASIGLLDVFA